MIKTQKKQILFSSRMSLMPGTLYDCALDLFKYKWRFLIQRFCFRHCFLEGDLSLQAEQHYFIQFALLFLCYAVCNLQQLLCIIAKSKFLYVHAVANCQILLRKSYLHLTIKSLICILRRNHCLTCIKYICKTSIQCPHFFILISYYNNICQLHQGATNTVSTCPRQVILPCGHAGV